MSSSTAKIFRSPARKIACESATITRMNCSRFSIGGGANPGSPVLIAGLAISSQPPLTALESVLVDHHANPATAAIFFLGANNAPMALHLHVGIGTNHFRRQRNREIDFGPDRH